MTRRAALVVLLLLLVGCAAPVPQPVAAYQSRNLGVHVNGRIVLGSVQLRTVAGVRQVDGAGICVVDQDGAPLDFPRGDGQLTPAWFTVSSTRSFPPGDYIARPCVFVGDVDQPVDGVTVPFTVM